MKRSIWIAGAAAAALFTQACGEGEGPPPTAPGTPTDRIVAAVEDEGVLAILDAEGGALLERVSLAADADVPVTIHNVQGSGDGAWVWATVMPRAEGGHAGMAMPEELVGLELGTGAVRRISLGEELHVAHVVLDGDTAYVSANEADRLLVVDLAEGAVTAEVPLPAGTGPHGLRLTPDRGHVAIAGLGDGSLHLVDTEMLAVASYDLPGLAVQTAVLPDGSAVLATLYDTRQVARLDLAERTLALFELPADSAGPLQLYPSPDSTLVWVADQGVLAARPAGHRLYALDAHTGELVRTVEVGTAPHGVVVEPDGRTVWVTSLGDGAVQAIDAETGAVVSTTPVGEGPNGITCVHEAGSMP